MAKDVDLSSKEWRDLVFEGKNKEFGAYVLRSHSDARHNKSMLIVTIVVLVALGLLITFANLSLGSAEEEQPDAAVQQQLAQLEQIEEAPEVEENEVKYEEPKEEVLKEEVANTVQVTNLLIEDEIDESKQIKDQDQLKETETKFGSKDFDEGTDDRQVVEQIKDQVVVEKKTEEVFTAVEQMPQFPGGESELLKWVSNHIKYPTMAMENNVQGQVVVQFVVTKDGSIGQVKVVRPRDPDLDKEAVRVVKSLPKFIPGKMNGQPVNVWYTLPIRFKLQGI